jgi:hypothetical protein
MSDYFNINVYSLYCCRMYCLKRRCIGIYRFGELKLTALFLMSLNSANDAEHLQPAVDLGLYPA